MSIISKYAGYILEFLNIISWLVSLIFVKVKSKSNEEYLFQRSMQVLFESKNQVNDFINLLYVL